MKCLTAHWKIYDMDRNFLTKITSVIIAVLIIAVITGYIVFLLNCKAAPLKHLIPLLIPLVISIILVLYMMIKWIVTLVKEYKNKNSDKNQ